MILYKYNVETTKGQIAIVALAQSCDFFIQDIVYLFHRNALYCSETFGLKYIYSFND